MSMIDQLIRHRDKVERYLKLYTSNPDDIEDIIQDVAIAVMNISVHDGHKPIAYLKKAAYNQLGKFYGKVPDMDPLDEDGEEPVLDILFTQLYADQLRACSDPMNREIYREKLRDAERKMEAITLPSNREAVRLLLVDGLGYREVSQITGRSEDALRKLMQRTREKAQ